MSRGRAEHRCSECGETSARWLGRCPSCGAWSTLVEEPTRPRRASAPTSVPTSSVVPIGEVDLDRSAVRPTGLGELDRVLGGGLVPGSVTLVGGEPGVGKSTLLLQALAAMAGAGARALLVTAEESAQQVGLRARRLAALAPSLHLVADASLPSVLGHLAALGPDVVVVDSIQTVFDPELGAVPGSVTQVRECAQRLVVAAKELGVSVILVGHVTKEGSLAGPRVLEHVVDTVLSFEGDRHHALRLVRAVKHRFGSTEELGLFEMTETGLAEVPDPSGLFLGDRRPGVAGSVVAPIMEGHRPLLVEVQALVSPSTLVQPRRSAQGLDHGRLTLVLAVLGARLGYQRLAAADVHASAVGGVRVVEPGVDLAVGLALVSSITDTAVPADLVACGEVGLGGELRQVSRTPRRLAEAARLGFTRAVVPASAPEPPPGIAVLRAATLAEALAHAGLPGSADPRVRGPSPRAPLVPVAG
ncbi:MAG: DNA repair protein RadA [Actinomycetota bacterium]|nr:DNA repair protein RadA [Actinomycetota bacterium]